MSSPNSILQVFAKKIENIENKLSNINVINPKVKQVSVNDDLKLVKEEMLAEIKVFIENYVSELMEKELNNIKQGMMRVIIMKIEQNMKVKLDNIKQELEDLKKSSCDNNLSLLDEIKKINSANVKAEPATNANVKADNEANIVVIPPPPQSVQKKTRKSRTSTTDNVTTKREIDI